jgi:hypothetical protein
MEKYCNIVCDDISAFLYTKWTKNDIITWMTCVDDKIEHGGLCRISAEGRCLFEPQVTGTESSVSLPAVQASSIHSHPYKGVVSYMGPSPQDIAVTRGQFNWHLVVTVMGVYAHRFIDDVEDFEHTYGDVDNCDYDRETGEIEEGWYGHFVKACDSLRGLSTLPKNEHSDLINAFYEELEEYYLELEVAFISWPDLIKNCK